MSDPADYGNVSADQKEAIGTVRGSGMPDMDGQTPDIGNGGTKT